MPLGEEPITAYFPRVTSGKRRNPANGSAKHRSKSRKGPEANTTSDVLIKRSSADKSGPSRKGSRKATTGSPSSVSSGTPPPVWDLFNEAPKRSRPSHAIDKASSVISLDDFSGDDTIMEVEIGPSTNATTISRPDNREISPVVRKKAPIVKGKQTRKALHYNFSTTNVPLSPKTSFRRKNVDARTTGSDDGDVEVLSSQVLERQVELFVHPSRDPISRRSTTETASTGDHPHKTRKLSPPRSSATFMPNSNHCSIIYNNDAVVDSSQTQNILLNYVSPHRPRTHKRLFIPDVVSLHEDEDSQGAENIVQSSQALSEMDLELRSRNFERQLGGSGSHGLVHTLPDALFAVPRRDAGFTLHSEEDLSKFVLELPSDSHESDIAVQDESVTESDSDGEVLSYLANNTARQDSNRSQSQTADRIQSSGDLTNTWSEDCESLPNAVKDFQVMFSSDGSDPPGAV